MSVGSVVQAGRVERELLAADGTGMAAFGDMRTSSAVSDVVSPELVLVDPDLAERARALLPELEEAVVRRLRFGVEPPGEPDSHDTAPSSADETFAAALRRISERALELEAPDPVRLLPLRGRHRRGLLAALAAVAAVLAAFLVDRQVGPSGDPKTVAASSIHRPSTPAVAAERTQSVGDNSGVARGLEYPSQSERPSVGVGRVEQASVPPTKAADTDRLPEPRARSLSATPDVQMAAPVWNPAPSRYVWARVAGASGYHVELVRGQERVFVTDTTRASVTVPRTWDLGGRMLERDPQDQLFVWPIVSGRRASEAIVDGVLAVDVPLSRRVYLGPRRPGG